MDRTNSADAKSLNPSNADGPLSTSGPACQWQPITDLPENWTGFASGELVAMTAIWAKQRMKLSDNEDLALFNERLNREWAIETGIIENLYSLDRGTTQLLIEHGIRSELIRECVGDVPADQVAAQVRDQQDALEGVFDFVAKRRSLSTSYIKEMHQAFTRHQATVAAVDKFNRRVDVELLRGDYKRLPNNPLRPDGATHINAPPEHVASEMDLLLKMHHEHHSRGVPPEVEAAWLHHRFTQIHPFQDGNGRIARLIASMIFIQAGLFPLVVTRQSRADYIDACEKADGDDLVPLVELFARIEKEWLVKALSLSSEVVRNKDSLQAVISAASERLFARRTAHLTELQKVFAHADRLKHAASDLFVRVAADLNDTLKAINDDYVAFTDESGAENTHWFRQEIVAAARALSYFADTSTYHTWTRLVIREERRSDLVVSFHSLGTAFSGTMAALPYLVFKDIGEDGHIVFAPPQPLVQSVFAFSYNEDLGTVESRFATWLDEVLLFGLDQWRRQL